jgi:hypothetical protein
MEAAALKAALLALLAEDPALRAAVRAAIGLPEGVGPPAEAPPVFRGPGWLAPPIEEHGHAIPGGAKPDPRTAGPHTRQRFVGR